MSQDGGGWNAGSHDPGGRVPVSLACTECKTRNYKTTKSPTAGPLELKKFCKTCKKHTIHRETK